MNTTKKFISVLLACVLAISSLAVSAFAWTGDGTQQFKFDVTADKEYVSAGDTVTFSVIANLAEGSTYNAFGAFTLSFMMNTNVLTPISYEYGPTIANFSLPRGYALVTAAATLNKIKGLCTAEEQAAWDANGYNAMIRVACVKDSSTEYGTQGYWEMGQDEVLFKITCQVADGVADGTPANFDCVSGILANKNFALATIDTTNNNKQTNQTAATLFDCSAAKSNVTVGTATTSSIIQTMGAQIRFKNVGSDKNFANYGNTFDVRTRAKISQQDFLAKFGSEEAAKAGVTDFGFVYATVENVPTFDIETAKKVAMGTAGAEGAKYVKKQCVYMQHANDGADYIFTCMIQNIDDADHNQVLKSIAYVCFNGEYIFMDTEATTDYATLYGVKTAA